MSIGIFSEYNWQLMEQMKPGEKILLGDLIWMRMEDSESMHTNGAFICLEDAMVLHLSFIAPDDRYIQHKDLTHLKPSVYNTTKRCACCPSTDVAPHEAMCKECLEYW